MCADVRVARARSNAYVLLGCTNSPPARTQEVRQPTRATHSSLTAPSVHTMSSFTPHPHHRTMSPATALSSAPQAEAPGSHWQPRSLGKVAATAALALGAGAGADHLDARGSGCHCRVGAEPRISLPRARSRGRCATARRHERPSHCWARGTRGGCSKGQQVHMLQQAAGRRHWR